jgi:hypothetical protein
VASNQGFSFVGIRFQTVRFFIDDLTLILYLLSPEHCNDYEQTLARRGEAGARAKKERDERQGNCGSSFHHQAIRSEPVFRTLNEHKLFSLYGKVRR